MKSLGEKLWKELLQLPFLLKTYFYLFKPANKTFLWKNSSNCESSNLIFAVSRQGCEEYTGERANKYLQTTYKTAAIFYIGERIDIGEGLV